MSACPPGFDCAFLNSCPAIIKPCPEGFLCSSYAGHPQQGDIDLSYAKMKNIYTDVAVTEKNKEDFVVPDRAVQSRCYAGFYCPNATIILPCPKGYWCPEGTVDPLPCDPLSMCGSEQTGFQINFVNATVMLALASAALISSTMLSRRQRKREALAQKKLATFGTRIAEDSQVGSSVPKLDGSLHAREVDEDDENDDPAVVAAAGEPNAKSPDAEALGLIAVEFVDLTFQPVSREEPILPSISGHCPAGQISAIMGPTGSGKSTLLNLLKNGGKGATSGSVKMTICDHKQQTIWELSSSALSKYVGYVPQEDIFDRELTVRELLLFFAVNRSVLPLSMVEANEIVNKVLSDLAISHIAETIIGGGENRPANISGGQLKRVNIACELVGISRPGVLILDEITSGLDAAVAYDLMKTLESICKTGVTIILVLQQPRVEIFTRIQHLFLMNTAGGIIFEGPSSEAATYLQSLGYRMDEESSDADYLLDVLNYIIPCQIASAELVPHVLHAHWQTVRGQHQVVLNGRGDSQRDEEAGDVYARKVLQDDQTHHQWGRRMLCQVYWNMWRLAIVRLRNFYALVMYIMISLIMACALSSGFSILMTDTYISTLNPPLQAVLQGFMPSPVAKYSTANISGMGLEQLMFFMSSALGSAACLAAVPVFAGQVAIARREYQSGLSLSAYVSGRVLADILFVVLNAFVFTGIWCLFGHAGSFYDWLAVVLSTAFAASAIGYISSASVRKNSASVFAIIGTFFFCVFAGVEPKLAQVSRYPVVSWPWYLSFATWTAEATYITWTRYLSADNGMDIDLQDGADRYGYQVDSGFGRSIGALIALGVAMRLVAMFVFVKKAQP